MADFVAPFMKNLAAKMQLILLVAYDSAGTRWGSLQVTTRTESAFEKVIKCCMDVFVHVSKTLTNLQIFGCELHQNAFGGRAARGPAGADIGLPRLRSRY